MITEDYCSYEVSKLLKERGFNEEIETLITHSGMLYHSDENSVKREKHTTTCNSKINIYLDDVSCPTHQMAMKYLREEKHIEIHIAMCALNADGSREYMYDIFFTNERYFEKAITKPGFKTFEEAVEAALKYCLTEIL